MHSLGRPGGARIAAEVGDLAAKLATTARCCATIRSRLEFGAHLAKRFFVAGFCAAP